MTTTGPLTGTAEFSPYAVPGHVPGEEYVGAARIVSDEGAIEVAVMLRGHVEPVDGHFHWFGRIAAHDGLNARFRSGATVNLRTDHGSADGRLSDVDPWGRFRIAGTGRPPF